MGLSKAGTGNRKWLRKGGVKLAHVGAKDYDDLDGFRRVQQDLKDQSFYTGKIDGYFWGASVKAFKAANCHNKIIYGDRLLDAPEGVDLYNYWHEPVKQLRTGGKLEADQILLHESVSSTWSKTVNVLLRRHLGVHLLVRKDGTAIQTCDLARRTVHAGRQNSRSVAVEAISDYYGHRAKTGQTVINAIWAHKKKYILPSSRMLDTIWKLVSWTTEHTEVPLTFPATEDGKFRWGRGEWKKPGIVAHHRSAHADGCFVEHYCQLRSFGHDHGAAWNLTASAASEGKRLTILPGVNDG